MSAQSDLQRYRTEATRIRTEIGRASAVVAAKRKKAASASAAAAKSKNTSTIRSKTNEAARATDDANAAEKKRAGLESKLADTEKKANNAQTKVDKERKADQDRADRVARDLQRRASAATSQFDPAGPFGIPVGGPVVHEPAPEEDADQAPMNADVFLSHASEDKDDIARPLRVALEERGVSVWFDEIRIKVGQSIRQEIERGIAGCRFGVVIVSPQFFAKQWTNAELDALFSKKMDSGRNLVLPVWHKVSKDEVMQQSPLLSGILALNTAVSTVDEIADALAEAVQQA